MHIEHVAAPKDGGPRQPAGIAHLAFAMGSEEQVDVLTRRLQQHGYTVADCPRRTGDGYYGSVVLDPDGNKIEITVWAPPVLGRCRN